jgi:hypothetical protein
MSAYHCPATELTVNRQTDCQRQARLWREAARAAVGLSESGWHWTDLKGAAASGKTGSQRHRRSRRTAPDQAACQA